LAAARSLPPLLRGPSGGVALRCTPDPLARALLERFGRPLTATSANPAGAPPATSVEQARAYFGGRVAAYVDGGARASAGASTVVEFSGARAYLRRTGTIELDALRAVTEIEPAGA
jgi:L-threonylcarbamoyladenylate synthase